MRSPVACTSIVSLFNLRPQNVRSLAALRDMPRRYIAGERGPADLGSPLLPATSDASRDLGPSCAAIPPASASRALVVGVPDLRRQSRDVRPGVCDLVGTSWAVQLCRLLCQSFALLRTARCSALTCRYILRSQGRLRATVLHCVKPRAVSTDSAAGHACSNELRHQLALRQGCTTACASSGTKHPSRSIQTAATASLSRAAVRRSRMP